MPRQDKDGLYKRPDSPYWWASYTDTSGKRARRSTGTTDRKEAEAILAKWKLETFRGLNWQETPDRTFDEVLLTYMKTKAKAANSHARDKTSAKHLFPVFTGRSIRSIAPTDIRRYIAMRKTEGASASSINKEIGLLSAAIGYVNQELGWELPNPTKGCKQKEPEGRVRWISRAEAAALIRAAERDPRATHLPDFIILALHTGCRKQELLGLEWRRVDLQARLIFLESHHTKSRKRRSIPLNRMAREAIVNRMRFRVQHCPASPWVFCDKKGNRIQDVKRSFATACRRAGIEDFRIHDLRHTCAAWLVSAGVPIAEVRDLLGHTSIEMTERYAHLAPENIREAVARLETVTSRFGHVNQNQ